MSILYYERVGNRVIFSQSYTQNPFVWCHPFLPLFLSVYELVGKGKGKGKIRVVPVLN